MLAQLKETDQHFAIKAVKKDRIIIEEGDAEYLLVEKRVLEQAYKHPYLTQLHGKFQTEVDALNIVNCKYSSTQIPFPINPTTLVMFLDKVESFPNHNAIFAADILTVASVFSFSEVLLCIAIFPSYFLTCSFK